MRRLYVVVRGDLPPGLQMAQACHAVREYAQHHADAPAGENLVVLGAQDEGELLRLWVNSGDCRGFLFREPDIGNQYTAFALDGAARALLSSLPLAGRDLIPLAVAS